jgi:transposase
VLAAARRFCRLPHHEHGYRTADTLRDGAGVNSPWEVKDLQLKLDDKKVEIELGLPWGADALCPECGRTCSLDDGVPERTWRHLDTRPFETIVRARVPRSDCAEHGVQTMKGPWAAPQGRFTMLFERFALAVLWASGRIVKACALLDIGWDAAHEIMRRAVERGLERRPLEALKHLGRDEKSFRRGQSYVWRLTDLEGARVVDVVETRTEAAADQLWATLTPEQKETVAAVAMDLGEP